MNNFSTMPLSFRVWDTSDKKFLENDELLDFFNGFTNFYDGEMITNKKQYHYVSIVYRDGKVMYDHGSDFDGAISRYEEVALIFEDELVGNIWQNPELLEEK